LRRGRGAANAGTGQDDEETEFPEQPISRSEKKQPGHRRSVAPKTHSMAKPSQKQKPGVERGTSDTPGNNAPGIDPGGIAENVQPRFMPVVPAGGWPGKITSHLLRLAGGRPERRWAWIAVRTVCSHTALPQSCARLAPACLALRLATTLRLATKLVIYRG